MLKNKSAVVTGSTSGIGFGIAQALARAGVNVMLNGFGDAAVIEKMRSDLAAETGVQVLHHPSDVSQPAEVAALIGAAADAFGAVDILVNNAGIQHVAPVDEFPEDKWTAIQSIIINSSFHAIKAALPGMKARNWGRIINLVSAHGLVASPFKSAYVTAKHGQIGLTKTVALEVAETGITCNAICPGYVRTPLVEGQIEAQAKAHNLPHDRVIREVILAAQPSKRFVEIDEVAALTIFLCGDAAKSITGTAIPIDGGWTAR
ncbi:MAG: 3-hydroxybutyrate dehydrogenase [Cephaloticoccus sp.]|nr:3-hydroxybutyrate dehydrogenase [Akkermansiaceae bacterium]MCF7760100.1 3-hydroxybutyrate dehydrogenase [Cephaloticoccus sp.]